MFFGIDPMYLLFMLPGLLIAMWAQAKMKSTFAKYNNVPTMQGITAAQAARRILDMNGLQNVVVEQVSGELTDHYDPRTNVVRLSTTTYNKRTIGAIGVAAHECGHAVQHATGYSFAKIRSAIVPVCNIGASLSVPLMVIGAIISMTTLIYVGIALFSLTTLFQLVTLPVEIDASKRAIATLGNSGMLTPEENQGATKVLKAAALTYVAAMLQSLMLLLYYVFRFGGRRRE